MQIRDVKFRLQEAGVACSYRGDEEALFRMQRMSLSEVGPGTFICIVDESWDRSSQKAFGRALTGDFDKWVQKATRVGVDGFICSTQVANHPALAGKNVLFSDSGVSLAVEIAKVIRDDPDRAFISAITGSAGKSTTKAMLAHALRATQTDLKVYSPGSTQNIFRSQVSHLTRLLDYDHAVLEVAGSCFSLFSRHELTISPDIAIVTSISEAHADYLGTLRDIALIKSQLFNLPAPGGTAIINADAPHSDLLIERAIEEGCQLLTYGEHPSATIRLVDYSSETNLVKARIGRQDIEYTIGAAGRHNAINSLAVLGALRSIRTATWRKGLEALSTFSALKGRGEITAIPLQTGGTAEVIDESYNANPASMQASLRMLSEKTVNDGAQRIAVLGDMLELGNDSEKLHTDLSSAASTYKPDVLHLYGPQMSKLYEKVRGSQPSVQHWSSLDELHASLASEIRNGDCVLVKASNGTGLGELVARLRGER